MQTAMPCYGVYKTVSDQAIVRHREIGILKGNEMPSDLALSSKEKKDAADAYMDFIRVMFENADADNSGDLDE